ncbi:MAG: tetratricopeptide repeat protein [Oligoflexia bacterium]|nr:tetratricopeptide repeat protein [Oligoflexia bacterium]
MNNTAQTTAKFCFACGEEQHSNAAFCHHCGQNLNLIRNATRLKPTHWALIACLAAILWYGGSTLTTSLAGARPTAEFKQEETPPADLKDPELDALRQAAKAAPQSKDAQLALAAKLIELLQTTDPPSRALIFEAIEVLGVALKLDPNDRNALISMADLSFSQQAFSKAAEFYRRFLALNKDDLEAKAKYASSLTFLGQFDEAVSLLREVLKKEPKNFNANAYLAITYAQKGDRKAALEAGQKALLLATNPEAKERFKAFLDSLEKSEHEKDAAAGSESNSSPTDAAGIVRNAIESSPVAAPKLSQVKAVESGAIEVTMNDFPMAAMPPFAKEKLFSRIKEALKAAASKEVKTIRFLDQASGQTMDQIVLE